MTGFGQQSVKKGVQVSNVVQPVKLGKDDVQIIWIDGKGRGLGHTVFLGKQ